MSQRAKPAVSSTNPPATRSESSLIPALVSWPCLLSLSVLVLNDVYLKGAFPGWLTGKLSDVAGIYLLALLFTAAKPTAKYFSAVVLAVGFLYWKSPLSQGLIDGVNALLTVQVGRVIDYTDLLALAMLPVAWRTVSSGVIRPGWPAAQKLLSVPVTVVIVLAVSGTSVLFPYGEFSIRNPDTENRVAESEFLAAIRRVATDYELQCESCDVNSDEARYFNDDMSVWYSLEPAANAVRFRVRVTRMKGWLLPSPDYDLYERFIRDLKAEFAPLSPSMEFVEALATPGAGY